MAGKVQMIFEGDQAKAVQALDKISEKYRKLEQDFAQFKRSAKEGGDQVGKVGESADEMGKKGEGAIGGMTRGFGSMLGSIVSVGGAIGLATKALADMNAERERAAGLAREMAEPLQQLVQISGSRAELGALTQFSRALSQQEGLTPQQAAQAVFTGRSLGFSLESIAEIAPVARFGDLGDALRGAGKFREAFGMAEIGSERGVLNKAGIAAKTSDIDFRSFLSAAIAPAAAFARIGATDESLLAALSVTSGPGGATPEIAATQLRSLATAFAKAPETFGGLGFFESVRKAQTLSPEELQSKVTGRVEAASAYTLLTRGGGELLGRAETMATRLEREGGYRGVRGWGGDWVSDTALLAEGDPIIGAILKDRRAKAGEEWAAIGVKGAERLSVDAAIAQVKEASARTGEPEISQWWRGMRMRTAQFFGAGPEQVQDIGVGGSLGPASNQTIGPILRRIQEEQRGGALSDEVVERLAQALEENTKATLDAGPRVSDNRQQTFYGAANERAQQRSPAPRRDPSTGR